MGTIGRALTGLVAILLLILYIIVFSGCTTSIGSKGSTALRTYPVPIEFHIAEGAYNNTQ